ncbi:uncharacterized protein LOC133863079 [Alnus glutinosa]|uniref:uncharacterized protein LOC133863079 n=1 Tax=Alnus glutinosa TaxID=3517 RepID=UPI002D786D19|nr:uncharacterized protein LOC133863079 [Alnus glutinosa]
MKPPPHQHSRINLADVKAQIVKRLGPGRSKQYFYYLSRWLSLKLSKVEFNKLCFRVLGRENVPLHNQFIQSILKNACHSKVPPAPTPEKEVQACTSDGYQPSGPYPLLNGAVFPSSPPKARSEILIGSVGKVGFASPQSTVTVDNVISEDGDCDIWKSVHHHQRLRETADSEGEVLLSHSAKLNLIKGSTDSVVSVHSKDQKEVLVAEDGKEVFSRSAVQAPLGIPFSSVSVGRVCRSFPLASIDRCTSSYDSGGLLETNALRERMQLIAAARGLEGVSMECANLLNSGLDAYIKGLIKYCIEFVGARCGRDLSKKNFYKHQFQGKLVTGVLPGLHFQSQRTNRLLEGIQEQGQHFLVSLLDFKVAMELNPQHLGKDWPLLLEKICTQASEE